MSLRNQFHREVSTGNRAIPRKSCSTTLAKFFVTFSSVAFQPSAPRAVSFPSSAGSHPEGTSRKKRLVNVRTATGLSLGVGSPQGSGPSKGGPLPRSLNRTLLQEIVEWLLDAVFPLLYIFEPEGMLDSYKNLRVLWVRALLAAAGELDDPVAARLLPAATRWLVSAPLARSVWTPVLPKLEWPGIMAYSIKRRTEFIDEALDTFLASNAASGTQIVLIGAGYDTRAARYQASGAAFYEVDLPEVTAMKSKMAKQLETSGSMMDGCTLGVDLNEAAVTPPGVFAQLELLGLDRQTPTLVVMEAVLLYLSPSAKRALLAEAGAFVSANAMSAVVLADNLSPFVSTTSATDTAAFLAPLGLSLQKHDWMFGGVMHFVCAKGVNLELVNML